MTCSNRTAGAITLAVLLVFFLAITAGGRWLHKWEIDRGLTRQALAEISAHRELLK